MRKGKPEDLLDGDAQPDAPEIQVRIVRKAGGVKRTLRRNRSYTHARSLFVLDRKTGAPVWTAEVAHLLEIPRGRKRV